MDKKRKELEAKIDARLKEFIPLLRPKEVEYMAGKGSCFMSNLKYYYKDKPYTDNVTRSFVDVARKVQDMVNEIMLLDKQIKACRRVEYDEAAAEREEANRRKTMAARRAKILGAEDAQVNRVIAKERARQRRREKARQIRMEVERRYAKK